MSRIVSARRRLTRDTILRVGEELFSRNGYHQTQVMEIVREVGISAGTFYKNFRDKDDLFNQITREGIAWLRETLQLLRAPVDIWSGADRELKLREMYAALFDYVDDHPQQLLMILRGKSILDKDRGGDTWSYFHVFSHDLAGEVAQWQTLGALRPVNPLLFAHAAVGMVLQTVHAYLLEEAFSREECIEALITFNLAMFTAYSPGGREDRG